MFICEGSEDAPYIFLAIDACSSGRMRHVSGLLGCEIFAFDEPFKLLEGVLVSTNYCGTCDRLLSKSQQKHLPDPEYYG